MSVFALPFMRHALFASLFSGIALSLIGIFVLARRVSFSGLAASQLVALGAVIGTVFGLHAGEFAMALVSVTLGMLFLTRLSSSRRVPEESWVACLYIAGAAGAVLFLSKDPQGETHTMSVFFGNVLALDPREVWESLAVLLLTVALLAARFHRWLWISFDARSAEISGLAVTRSNAVFFALFALVMTVAIHIFGVLLAFAYLILPATIGMALARRVRSLLIWAPLLTAAVTVAGFYTSFRLDFPAGPWIAGLLAALALTARLAARLRR